MKKMSIIFILAFLGYGLADDFHSTRELKLEAKSIELLDVDCGSGFLKIEGDKERNEILVQAEIYMDVSDEETFDEILDKSLILELDKFGHKAKLISKIDQSGSFLQRLFNGGFSSRIDLTIHLPYQMALKIDDGSGFISINNIGDNVELDDGSGNIELNNVAGNVSIDDGSGNLSIINCGEVRLDDGAGAIYIEGIAGPVWVDDGAGDITIRDVRGDVEIDDGSGDIDIEQVQGDVIIKDSGSGGLHTRKIAGRVINEED